MIPAATGNEQYITGVYTVFFHRSLWFDAKFMRWLVVIYRPLGKVFSQDHLISPPRLVLRTSLEGVTRQELGTVGDPCHLYAHESARLP